MRNEWNFWVVGGDLRQVKLAWLLAEDGHTVHTWALEGAEEAVAPAEGLEEARLADCVILPLPAAGEGGRLNAPLSARKPSLEEVVRALRPGQVVCAGRAGPELRALAEAQRLRLYDYFQAMEELPITLHGARVLVLGFGRLGKLTAHRLHALGARVSVAARKWADLAWAEAYGCAPEHLACLDGYLCPYDLVVNTVPARVLDGERLADLKPGCLVIDLASRPGGVDLEAAARLGVRVIWALSLPGRVAPVTAGKILRDTIYHILDELGG